MDVCPCDSPSASSSTRRDGQGYPLATSRLHRVWSSFARPASGPHPSTASTHAGWQILVQLYCPESTLHQPWFISLRGDQFPFFEFLFFRTSAQDPCLAAYQGCLLSIDLHIGAIAQQDHGV